MTVCRWCDRGIVRDADGQWVDPEATGDDAVWREVCDRREAFLADHEPDYPDRDPTLVPEHQPAISGPRDGCEYCEGGWTGICEVCGKDFRGPDDGPCIVCGAYDGDHDEGCALADGTIFMGGAS